MDTTDKTSKEALETSGTGGSQIAPKEETTDQTEDFASDDTTNIRGGGQPSTELTPLEAAKKRHYESEEKKNRAKEVLFKVLQWLIPIFVSILVGFIAFWGTIWLYKIDKLSDPISKLEERTTSNGIRLDKLEGKIDAIDDELQETREEFIRNK